MLARKYSCQGHHYKFNVGNRNVGLHCLFLCILHHDNELGDAIHLHIILHHICAQGDHAMGMKPSAVCVKEGHDVNGRDLHVEGGGVFQVVVPNFINDVMEKIVQALLGHLLTSVVVELGFMGSLCLNASNCCGVLGNRLVVEWETEWAYNFGTVVGFVLDGFGEDGREGVNPIQLVVGDDHEKGENGLLDGKQVIVGWLPFEGGEGVMGLFKEASDCVGCHFG
jgi:hypothetical protein